MNRRRVKGGMKKKKQKKKKRGESFSSILARSLCAIFYDPKWLIDHYDMAGGLASDDIRQRRGERD
jgi:hypothetical protein